MVTSEFTINILNKYSNLYFIKSSYKLKKARFIYQLELEKLNKIIYYEREYRNFLKKKMKIRSIDINVWTNYQSFITCLYNLINHHKEQVKKSKIKLNIELNNWKKEKKKLNAFDILKIRHKINKRTLKNRILQKQMDEISSKMYIRGIKS
ncbi:fliJ [Wigglesworthia glossinidia endosymbiont of Glossina brevipalpis]|uniref:Flagellar FliJ protein n=1 Tax=Wigglesworthia glossinidia brevipalpis TaxID=36870 RepID=Q8D3E5_WIGBR|nr:fliJ [Wigglesworthia glossinidia endosymbiont of Glossina brevipalpis]